MGALKKSGVLCRVNGGIARHGERVNGGNEKSQWGICQGQWGHWSGSVGVLKRVNGGIGQGKWGY